VASGENDILSGDTTGCCRLIDEESRKGFVDIGLVAGEGSAGVSFPEAERGDAARLRKGLLDDKLSVSPGDGRESINRIFVSIRVYACP